MKVYRHTPLAVLLALAACQKPAATPPPDAPANQAQLANAAAIANEAAADEARDIRRFGGNATAIELNRQ